MNTPTVVTTLRTGYYWAKLNSVISDGWEIVHWSEAWKSFQIHGRDNNYGPEMIVEICLERLEHPNWER